jgi:hypothetical protein
MLNKTRQIVLERQRLRESQAHAPDLAERIERMAHDPNLPLVGHALQPHAVHAEITDKQIDQLAHGTKPGRRLAARPHRNRTQQSRVQTRVRWKRTALAGLGRQDRDRAHRRGVAARRANRPTIALRADMMIARDRT